MENIKHFILITGSCLALLNACSPTNKHPDIQTSNSDSHIKLNQSQSKIVNGEAVIEEDPIAKSTVALYLADTGKPGSIQNFCTGTLVAKNIVITAAHCIKDFADMLNISTEELITRIRIGFGTQVVKNEADTKVSFEIIKQVLIHPDYTGGMVRNAKRVPMPDLALILLENDAPETTVPATLGSNLSHLIKSGTPLTLAGYGVTSGVQKTLATQLMKVDVTITNPKVTSAQFSYNVINRKTACMGDSGGPAYVKTEDGNLTVIGVTSWGDRTCTSIGVYTSIPAFSEFITAAMAKFQPRH